MIQTVEIYYSFQCPYSYLAIERLSELEQKFDAKMLWHPFSAKAAGQTHTSNGGQSDRQSYVQEDCTRLAKEQNIPIVFVDNWPNEEFNPEKMTRGAFVASDMGILVEYNVKVFARWWQDGMDPNDQDFFVELCDELDVNPNEFAGRMSTSDIRERVKGAYKRGRKLRVFDTPMIVVGEERFWGLERIDAAEARLKELGLARPNWL